MKGRGSLGAVLIALLLLCACGSGDSRQRSSEEPPGDRLLAEVNFPLAVTDLRVMAVPGSDAELRRLAAAVAGIDGVAVSEADYSQRSVDVLLEDRLDDDARAGVVRDVAATPGVASAVPLR